MRGRWVLLVAALLAPLAAGQPAPEQSDEMRRYVGIATQGSYDHGHDWLDAWMGEGNWDCLQSTTDDVYVLTVLSGAPGDALLLETQPFGLPPARAAATLAAPAVLEGYSSSLCLEFAVIGASVADAARYQVDVIGIPPWEAVCHITC